MIDKERIKNILHLLHSLEIGWQTLSLMLLYVLIMLAAFFLRWEVGLMLFLLLAAFLMFVYFNYATIIKNMNLMANQLSLDVKLAQEASFYQTPIGIMLYNPENHRVKWINPMMQHFLGNKEVIGMHIEEIDDRLLNHLEQDNDKQWHIIDYRNRHYKMLHNKENHSIFLLDVTEEVNIRNYRKIDRTVFGYLFLDDYDEIVESMDDKQATNFDSEVINDIDLWANRYGIFTKRIDDDKFILLLNQYTLELLEKDRFKYFNDLRQKYLIRNTPLSFSIGIAYPDLEVYNLNQLSNQAQSNLDLALGRGGDQVVVRSENERARFYGGRTDQNEKRTNIRSRLIYQGLKTPILQADNIIIGGHKTPDMDSMGAALGLYRICRILKKSAYIVVNSDEFRKDIRELLALPQAEGLWDAEVLIDIERAHEIVTDSSVVIMVDHHRPSMSEVESLIGQCDTVVIDHHRRGEEFPEDPILTYIEPYASSTSEMITEFFMNMRNTTESINKFEATALLGGIIVDTNNFTNRTGSRTFDAASFLKARGADSRQIQRILRENLESMIQRNHLIERTEMYLDHYAIIKADDKDIVNNVTAAQAADYLLEVDDVEASFVIYRRSDNVIGISARSLGRINVQTIMERLGGGGHLSNAATQIEDVTVEETYQALIQELKLEQE